MSKRYIRTGNPPMFEGLLTAMLFASIVVTAAALCVLGASWPG